MDRTEYAHKRKARYMAQLLEYFEQEVEPRLPADVAKDFKGMVRRKFQALAVDVTEVLEMEDMAINQHAQDLKDRVYPDGDPKRMSGESQRGRR